MTPEAEPLERFSLLAHAAARRRIAVAALAGGPAYTDGEVLYVPMLPEPQLQACLIAQAGLLAVGSFDARIMVRIAGRPALARRYLLLEAQRAVNTLRDTIPARVSDEIAALHAGPVSASPAESLARAMDRRVQIPEAPTWLGTIKPLTMLWARPPRAEPDENPEELSAPVDAVADVPDLADRSRTLELLSMPVPRLAPIVKKVFGIGAAPTENVSGGKELRIGGRNSHAPGPKTRKTGGTTRAPVDARSVPVGYRYPEWDLYRGRYRPDWCTVTEVDPSRASAEKVTPPTADPSLRRELAQLGLTHQRHRHQADGDELDVTALVDLVVARAHGTDEDPRVYESRRRTARDLGVLVLLDTTGSTGAATSGQRVFDLQRDVAARLTAALDELGYRVALYGFFSQGRDAVRYLRIKSFDDRYDHSCRRRLASLSPGGFTRLGAAIRHGIHILLTRAGTSKLLLVVIGDGRPYENGYEDHHAEHDSRMALQESVAKGVGCVCLNVGPSANTDVLERVWGEFSHRHLEDASSLARHVRPLFSEAVRAAGASKRSVQPIPAHPARRER